MLAIVNYSIKHRGRHSFTLEIIDVVCVRCAEAQLTFCHVASRVSSCEVCRSSQPVCLCCIIFSSTHLYICISWIRIELPVFEHKYPDRQTASQPDKQTNRQTDRQTNKQTNRQTDRDTDTDRQTDRDRERQTERDRQTDKHMKPTPTDFDRF